MKVAMVLEENKFRLPGMYIQESYRRRYPFQEVGAHVLGYLGKISRFEIEEMQGYGYSPQSVIGKNGVEEYYNSFLMGKTGGLQIEVDSRGKQVRLLSLREPEDGEDIQLTIDSRIQKIAAEILADQRGVIVVMDLDSGQILGQVSSPTYDPNIFVDHKLKKKTRSVMQDPASALLNRAIKGLYPPGSVFKTVIATAGLATGKISLYTSFDCRGAYQPGRKSFRCGHVHGKQDLIAGIAHSCNVYFFHVGALLGPDLIHKYARLLGLGAETHIDLPYEEKGNIPSPMQRKIKFNQGWHKGDTLNYAIGQGDVLTTPVQLLRMMSTVARHGKEVQPHLIMSIGNRNIVKLATVRQVRIPQDVFEKVNRGFSAVVNDDRGTARMLKIDGLQIAGKTGTAQSSGDRDDHSWFIGYETSGKIRTAFCVFLEYGGSSYHAVLLSRKLLMRLREENII
jgi:penicillin-binding protein 2